MSKINTPDPRVLRTRQLLRTALVSLISEKGYSSTTIQNITDRATLNRATFYLHYRDKNELLTDAFSELIVKATPLPPTSGIPAPQDGIEWIALIFRQMSKNADFFRTLLTKESAPAFNLLVRDYIMEIGLKWLTALQPEKNQADVHAEIASNFLGSAYLGVIAWWLQNGMPYTPEYMASQLMNLTVLGLTRALGIEPL
jgi:AcrR family transcriptional regulator